MSFRYRALCASCVSAVLLGGCAGLVPPEQVVASAPTQWQEPLPHGGTLSDLSQWWRSQGDPVLVEFIDAAQAVSPGVAQALARVASARAAQASAGAALLPQVTAQLSSQRGQTQPGMPLATTHNAQLFSAWELDLVGANRAVNRAAAAQVAGSEAQWHEARVSVAAEVANLYHGARHCRAQLELQRQDTRSRAETARLSAISTQAGLVSPGTNALAQASAADAGARLTQQTTACALDVKALVALTGFDEATVQRRLDAAPALSSSAGPATFQVATVPAQTLAQRPDVYAAERDVAVAAAQVGAARAQRWPRLSLLGSVGVLRQRNSAQDADLNTWSFGPLALTLPVFDAGQRSANVDAAQAQYAATVSAYQSRVRHAVREVEEALLTLASVNARATDVQAAADGFAKALSATRSRHEHGLASLPELEEARRQALAAQSAQTLWLLERQRAWVGLYRALGGGFAHPLTQP